MEKLLYISYCLSLNCFFVSGASVAFQPSVQVLNSEFYPIGFHPQSSSFVETRRESKEDVFSSKLTNPFEFKTEDQSNDNIKLTNPFEFQRRPTGLGKLTRKI
jgi:hypothetical protein